MWMWLLYYNCLNSICLNFQTAQQQLSKKEIEDLLRRGAYGAIMDEEDEGAKFCEEDIDQILQRRTKTITIESEGRGSTFAKVNKMPALDFRLIVVVPIKIGTTLCAFN